MISWFHPRLSRVHYSFPHRETSLYHLPSCRRLPLRLFYRETVVISGNLGSTIWKRILKAGWNATNVAPTQCFYVGQDQKTRVSVHSWLVAPIDVLLIKNWLNKIFEQKFIWRWYACKVKLHGSFVSEIVLDLQGSGVSICITQIILHNIQVALVFKQKSWNTNCKQTNLTPAVYNYWQNVVKVSTT